MKRAAWFTAIVLGILTATLVLWQFRSVLGLFVLSLAVAAVARPVIVALMDRKIPTGWAILVVYGIGIALFLGLATAFSQPLLNEFQKLANDFSAAYDSVKATWPQGTMIQQMIANQIPNSSEVFGQITGTKGMALAETVLGVTLSLVDLIGQILLILVLSLYWSTDNVRFERLWLSLLPAEQRMQVRAIWRRVESGVGVYIRSEMFQSLLAVMVLSVGYTLMGMRYPVIVAIIAAVLWFIPLVGGLLIVVVVAAVGMLSGPLIAGAAAVLTIALLAVLELVVEPRLFDRKSYNAILVLLVMIAMTDAFGLLGLVVAPPLAVAIQICLSELTSPNATGAPAAMTQTSSEQVVTQLDQIRDRISTVRHMLDQVPEPSPRLISMTERLEGLVVQLDPLMTDDQSKQKQT